MSCQQNTVALSSTEAEYMALSSCGCQLIWIRNFLNKVSLMFQLLISIVIILVHFSGDLILYKRSTLNTLIFAITKRFN